MLGLQLFRSKGFQLSNWEARACRFRSILRSWWPSDLAIDCF